MLKRGVLSVGLAMVSACVIRPVGSTTTQGPPPPPPRAEQPPPSPGPGYLFVSGRWFWQNSQWVWVPGHWEREHVNVVVTQPVDPGPPPPVVDTRPPPPPVVDTRPPPPPRQPQDPRAVAMLALAEGSSCSLSVAGEVRCWGYNHYGALGVGSRAQSASGVVGGLPNDLVSIAAGGHQQCVLTSRGDVWCWGSNLEGQVGNGSVAASEEPVRTPIRVDGISNVRSLHLGDKITCAITRASELYCWGRNAQHEIDDSMSKQITRPTRVRTGARVDTVAVGNYHLCYVSGGRTECRGNLAPVNGDAAALTGITSISAGYQHTCAIHDGGRVSCWGGEYGGVLGQGDQCGRRNDGGECVSRIRPPMQVPGLDPDPVEIAGNTYFTCVRFSSGRVTCFGSNQGGAFSETLPKEFGQKPHVLAGVTADRLFVGGGHVCTMLGSAVTCRGNDGNGAVSGARR